MPRISLTSKYTVVHKCPCEFLHTLTEHSFTRYFTRLQVFPQHTTHEVKSNMHASHTFKTTCTRNKKGKNGLNPLPPWSKFSGEKSFASVSKDAAHDGRASRHRPDRCELLQKGHSMFSFLIHSPFCVFVADGLGARSFYAFVTSICRGETYRQWAAQSGLIIVVG